MVLETAGTDFSALASDIIIRRYDRLYSDGLFQLLGKR